MLRPSGPDGREGREEEKRNRVLYFEKVEEGPGVCGYLNTVFLVRGRGHGHILIHTGGVHACVCTYVYEWVHVHICIYKYLDGVLSWVPIT